MHIVFTVVSHVSDQVTTFYNKTKILIKINNKIIYFYDMNSIIPLLLAIGTYTVNTSSSGIYLVELDLANKSSKVVKTIPANNPSFLHYTDHSSTLYYVEEVGKREGMINATRLNRTDLSFEKLSAMKTQGNGPCHVEVSPDKGTLIASNYSSGNFTAFALSPNGEINQELSNYPFEANSIHPTRQKRSHIHSAFYSPNGKNVFIQDLGGDHIYQFEANAIHKNGQPYTTYTTPKGAGPRHIAFSSDNRFVYVINELNGTIDVYGLDKKGFIRQHLQNIATDTTVGDNLCAHIRLSADSKFLYASNRGDKNSIAVYAVAKNGKLTLQQVIASGGKGPRHFEFTKDENYIIVAHQYTNNVTLLHRDRDKGLLTHSGIEISIPSPVCVVML